MLTNSTSYDYEKEPFRKVGDSARNDYEKDMPAAQAPRALSLNTGRRSTQAREAHT